MKLLYIITQADGGGAQKYVLDLAKHFNGVVAAGNEAGRLFVQAQMAGLKTFELENLKRNINPWYDLLAIWEIRNLIQIYRPDIVHLNSTKAGILGSFAAMGLKTKVVFTAHGFIFNEPLPRSVAMFYLALEKTASSHRDFIITVSEADKISALNNNLIANNKIQTVHNGISKPEFLSKDQAVSDLGVPKNKIQIGCIANAYKTKGLDILISAVAKINKETRENIFVSIIGDGPELQSLKVLSESLKLKETVKFFGKVENASGYLKAFDIFVLPSRKEGFAYALLEAQSAGLPIIATDVGGNKEALGTSAILIPPKDSQALAKAIADLVKDGSLRSKLSSLASTNANQFSMESMLNQTEKIYKKILGD